MKRLLLMLAVAFLLNASHSAVAQTKTIEGPGKRSAVSLADSFPKFTGNSIVVDDQTQVMTVTGNASFKTDKFQTTDAEKIVFDKISNKVVMYGCKGFRMDGKVVVRDNTAKTKTVEYTVGEDTVYMLWAS